MKKHVFSLKKSVKGWSFVELLLYLHHCTSLVQNWFHRTVLPRIFVQIYEEKSENRTFSLVFSCECHLFFVPLHRFSQPERVGLGQENILDNAAGPRVGLT